MSEKGIFISFEGIDGAGKSTHIQVLADALRAAGRTVVLTREPGGTALAEEIRALVLNRAMDALTEALLMFAARRDHVRTVIAPALARCEVVLCDRFTDATFAYQGAGRGFDWGTLATLERWVQDTGSGQPSVATAILQPNLTLWFDLPPAAAAARRAGMPDRFEREPAAFFAAVRSGYERRAHEDPVRLVRIDAAQAREQVARAVRAAVANRGWL
jgi:dTMP kinase